MDAQLKKDLVEFLEELANTRPASNLTKAWQYKDPDSRKKAARVITNNAQALLARLEPKK